MYVCRQCNRRFDEYRLAGRGDVCPNCGAMLERCDERTWTNVARVANLAEAGFLTDELAGHGIEADIHQTQEFSALSDRWESQYLIRVPAENAQEAAAFIREHATQEPDRSQGIGEDRFDGASPTLESLHWRPVMLVLLAGVSSFVLGQRFSEVRQAQAEQRPQRETLSSAVQAIDRPFVTESAAGEPAYRLRFDHRRQSWLLETDRDGDGRFDSQQMYHAAGGRR